MVDIKHREYEAVTTGNMNERRQVEVRLIEPLDGESFFWIHLNLLRVLA